MPTEKALPKSSLKDFNQALTLQNSNKFNEAIFLYKKLLLKHPNKFEIKLNLATSLYGNGDLLEATEAFHKLHEISPTNTTVLASCSACYKELGRYEIALEFLKLLIKLDETNVTAWLNMTYICSILKKNEDSLYFATQAISLNPKEPKLYNNLGSALQNYHRYDDALICYDTALKLDPTNINALTNTATVFDKLGDYPKSIAIYNQALLGLKNDSNEYKSTCYRMSFPLLSAGEIKKGWEYYEFGFFIGEGKGRLPNRKFKKPRWAGQDIKGKSLLVWREQGIGDELWFYSILSEVFSYCDDIIIECEERLIPLLQRSFNNVRVRREFEDGDEDFDYQIPVGSLLKIYRSDIKNFPKSKGYLITDNDKDSFFKEALSPFNKKLLVGISWRSGLLTSDRNIHYAPLSDWSEILQLDNIQFVNLQYGDTVEELVTLKNNFNINIINFESLDIKNDIDSLASLIKNLDLVISASTFAAPLTQAVGTPLKLLSHKNWTTLGQDTWPWYENVKIYSPASLLTPIKSIFSNLVNDLVDLKK